MPPCTVVVDIVVRPICAVNVTRASERASDGRWAYQISNIEYRGGSNQPSINRTWGSCHDPDRSSRRRAANTLFPCVLENMHSPTDRLKANGGTTTSRSGLTV